MVIDKPLSLISYIGTTLNSRKNKPIITIKSTNGPVNIYGFKFNNTVTDSILIENASNITISHNTITSKSNGVKAIKVKNLNIINNNIIANSKSGIALSEGENLNILKNYISNNDYGIALAQSSNIKVWNNSIIKNNKGIYSTDQLNNYLYPEGASKLSIMYNTIKRNVDGIDLDKSGDGIKILNNTISNNQNKGISLNSVGSNKINQNTIEHNSNGIYFGEYYIKPKGQDISYNVIQSNTYRDVNAMDSSYGFGSKRLEIGVNWYGGNPSICNKIKTGFITFGVKQTGTNTVAVTFYNPDGSVVSTLPSRTISYKNNNGRVNSVQTTGSTTKITVEGTNGDKITVTVDRLNQQITYKVSSDDFTDNPSENIDDENIRSQEEVDNNWQNVHGNSGDSGTGTNTGGDSGTGTNTGENSGNGTSSNNGNGGSSSGSNSNQGISGSTSGANTAVGFSSIAAAVASSVSSSSSTSDTSSGADSESTDSASDSSSSGSDSGPKLIEFDENQFTRLAGEFLVLLIIIFGCYIYYRNDIKKSL